MTSGYKNTLFINPKGINPQNFKGGSAVLAGEIEGIPPDAEGGLFSRSLNLWLRWEDYIGNVRLLRPYLPDGTPITTSAEEAQLRAEEAQLRKEAQARAQQAETRAQREAHRRQQVELELEQLRAELAALQDEGS